MTVMHSVIGVSSKCIFISHFLDQSGECRAGNIARVQFDDCWLLFRRLGCFLFSLINQLVQIIYTS
jgi:hypothetical protein